MLPAELMGLKSNHFKQFNNLIKDKKFLNSLILNVESILQLIYQKKFNSILINYDEDVSKNFKDFEILETKKNCYLIKRIND